MQLRLYEMLVGIVAIAALLGRKPINYSQEPLDGSATITGTVTTDAGEPVFRAVVSLKGGGSASASAVSDEMGRYSFASVPPGSYILSASKPGLVTAYYGSIRPGRGPAVPVSVQARRSYSKDFVMLRGAVIFGRVLDLSGRGAGHVLVEAFRVGKDRRITDTGNPGASSTTGTDGAYRLYGLAPDSYIVVANPESSAFHVSPPTSERGLSSQVDSNTWTIPRIAYPGVVDLDRAASIILNEPGDEIGGVDFALRAVRSATVAGVVVDSTGRPISKPTVILGSISGSPNPDRRPVSKAGGATSPGMTQDQTKEGRFAFPGLLQGRYLLIAYGLQEPSTDVLVGELELTVNDRDILNALAVVHPTVRVSGSGRFAGQVPSPKRITFRDERSDRIEILPLHFATVGPGGRFALNGLPVGRYEIGVESDGGAWFLESASRGSLKLQNGLLEITDHSPITDLQIVFTDRGGQLIGRLLTDENRPSRGFSVVIFPADKAAWGRLSRAFRVEVPADDGSFVLEGIPAGDYLFGAAAEVALEDLRDPAVLERLATYAIPFHLRSGELKNQDFRVKGG